MLHARDDYNRIQDPKNKIGQDEPVFLVRAHDLAAPDAVDAWANANIRYGGNPEVSKIAREHATKMRAWQVSNGAKVADI